MNRRQYLSVCGASIAGLAGCSGGPGSDDTPAGPNGSDEPTATPGTADATSTANPTAGGPTLSVTPDRLQRAVVELTNPDSIGLRGGSDTQYLYLDVAVTAGEPPARSDLEFRFDGAQYDLGEVRQTFGLYRAYSSGDTRYDGERESGWLVFELPATGDASDAALVWSGGEWTPGQSLRERLGAEPPALSAEWSAPESVTDGTTPTIEFTATNEGDIDSRFVAALNRKGGGIAYIPVAAVSHLVPAGSTETWTLTDSRSADAGAGDDSTLTYLLGVPGESRRRENTVTVTTG